MKFLNKKNCSLFILCFVMASQTVFADVCPQSYKGNQFKSARIQQFVGVECNYGDNNESYQINGDFRPLSDNWISTSGPWIEFSAFCQANNSELCSFVKKNIA